MGSITGEVLNRLDGTRESGETPAVESDSQPDLVVPETEPGVSQTESIKHPPRMSSLGLVPAIVVLAVATISATLRLFGPAPQPVKESSLLSDAALANALKEPADRLILLSWWLLALIGALAAAWFVRRAAKRERKIARIVHYVLNVAAVAVIIAAITWGPLIDGGTPSSWVGVGTIGLFVSLAAALLIFRIWTWPEWAMFGSTVIVAGITTVFAIPALWQMPHSIRDPYHFTFTSDEFAAVAAGHLPLSDYIPQYSVLLGFPVAPLLRAFPSDAVFIILAWVIFLQVVALLIAVSFPILLAGKRMLAPAMMLGVMPVLATGHSSTLFSASSYFACFPMRVVLPAGCLLVAFLVMRNRNGLDARSHIWKWAVLGFLVGVVVLNNLDFGLPAALVVLITIFLTGRTWRECLWPALVTLICATGSVALYVGVAAMTGRSVSLWHALFFARTFGVEGFNNASMGAFGFYVVAVSLFICAAIFGYVFIRQGRHSRESFLYQQGLALALVGGWSLLSLTYFAGRSYDSTLVGGHGFQIGLVTAAFLPLIWKTLSALLRVLPERFPWEAGLGMVMGTLVIAAGWSFTLGVRVPSEYVKQNRTGDSPGIAGQKADLQDLFADPINSRASRLVSEGRVQQALIKSNLTSLSTGMRSALIVSHPSYLGLSPAVANLQCRQSWPQGVDHILVERDTVAALKAAPECQNYVDFERAMNVIHGQMWLVLLPAAKAH